VEQDRITRIARAMCRAARIDPDKPIDMARGGESLQALMSAAQASTAPAWMHFKREAAAFVARHRAVAENL
jgi:hypothetical protein